MKSDHLGGSMRKNNKADMTISEQLESIKERICDGYCKYPELAKLTHDDSDEALEWMMRDCCEHCPLMEL